MLEVSFNSSPLSLLPVLIWDNGVLGVKGIEGVSSFSKMLSKARELMDEMLQTSGEVWIYGWSLVQIRGSSGLRCSHLEGSALCEAVGLTVLERSEVSKLPK